MRNVKDVGKIQSVVPILISLTLGDVLMKGMDANPVLISQDCVAHPQPVRDARTLL